MLQVLFYLITLQTIYYTVKTAVIDAIRSIKNINITYTKTKPNLDYYDERNENLDELD